MVKSKENIICPLIIIIFVVVIAFSFGYSMNRHNEFVELTKTMNLILQQEGIND